MPVLVPQLSSTEPYNFGVAETYSYVPIANDQGRPLYAKAGYITNFSDLAVSLSTGDINIGSVHVLDSNNGLTVSVADVGLTGLDAGKGALRVLSQDLDSDIDDITIGDKKGNFASVNAATSALQTFVVNSVSATITNPVTGVTVLNPVTSLSAFVINPQVEVSNDVGNPIPVNGVVQISSVNISDANWLFQVGRGKIAGATLKSFTGYTSAVGTTFQPMWEDGTYTFLTSAQQLTLKSTSNSDTNVSVFIDGLDSNYNPLTETLVLTNGTVGVTTVNSYYRINSISLTRTPMPVGRISIGNANTLAFIDAGTDRSAMTVFSVPNGYTFFLERVNAFCTFTVNTVGNNNIPINAFYRSNTVNNGLRNIILTSPFYSNYASTRISPRGYPQKTDCLWECRSESDTYKPAIGLQIEGILISNSAL